MRRVLRVGGSGVFRPIDAFDPGWLFVLAGVVLVGATVLVPAVDELAEARFQRDRAMALERHRAERLGNYEQYLSAIERGEPALVTALAAQQLNQIPQGRALILEPAGMFSDPAGSIAASPFGGLEPEPLVLPEREPVRSTLQRLATGDGTRPWLMAGGMMCVLLGLLPWGGGRGERAVDGPAAE